MLDMSVLWQSGAPQEKHIEGLIEKFTLRLEQSASGAGGEVAAEVRIHWDWKDLDRKAWESMTFRHDCYSCSYYSRFPEHFPLKGFPFLDLF